MRKKRKRESIASSLFTTVRKFGCFCAGAMSARAAAGECAHVERDLPYEMLVR